MRLRRNVSGVWDPLLNPGANPNPAELWSRPTSNLQDHVQILEGKAASPQSLDASRAAIAVVDTVGGVDTIPELTERVAHAVERVASGIQPRAGRHLPLVALPLPGVGQGNFPGQRAPVVRAFVERLQQLAQGGEYDVALVLIRRSDFAAAQWARHELTVSAGASVTWRSLTDEQIATADDLGKKAAEGVLSLFVEAGVSRPLGFPDWLELLNELNGKLDAPITTDNPDESLPARAERIEQKLGRELGEEVAPRFTTRRHALGHALLAGLQINTMVTTNYDPCLENASAAVRTDEALRVLTRQVAVGGKPWLLKLHGDIQEPRSIVLTTRFSHQGRSVWAEWPVVSV